MVLDFTNIIKQLKVIEKEFNDAKDPENKYLWIKVLNHLAEEELPIHGYWEDEFRKATLRKRGCKI